MLLFTAVILYHTHIQVKGSYIWRRLTSTCTHKNEINSNTTVNASCTIPYHDINDSELREPLPEEN